MSNQALTKASEPGVTPPTADELHKQSPAVIASATLAKPTGKVQLPKDCEYLSLDGKTAAVVICRAPDESFLDKFTKDSPSLLLSLLTICVSIYAFAISGRQQKAGLLHSIKDDYWLRTVISPTCITPLLEMRKDVLSKVAEVNKTPHDIQDLTVLAAKEFGSMYRQLSNLSLISGDLVEIVRRQLELVEDRVNLYLGELASFIDDPTATSEPDLTKAITEISSLFYGSLLPIQAHQMSLLEHRSGKVSFWRRILGK